MSNAQFKNMDWPELLDAVEAMNTYLFAKGPSRYHESTFMGNRPILIPDDETSISSNEIHAVLRNFIGRINKLVDYKKLSEPSLELLKKFKEYNLRHTKLVKSFKNTYEKYYGEGSAKKGNKCPFKQAEYYENRPDTEFRNLRELKNKIREKCNDEDLELYRNICNEISENDCKFALVIEDLKISLKEETCIPLKSGKLIENEVLKPLDLKNYSALSYLYFLGRASIATVDTTQNSEPLRDDYRNLGFMGWETVIKIHKNIMMNDKFQIPEFKEVYVETLQRAQTALVKNFTCFGDMKNDLHKCNYQNTVERLQEVLLLTSQEDFDAVKEKISQNTKIEFKKDTKKITQCPMKNFANQKQEVSCPYTAAKNNLNKAISWVGHGLQKLIS